MSDQNKLFMDAGLYAGFFSAGQYLLKGKMDLPKVGVFTGICVLADYLSKNATVKNALPEALPIRDSIGTGLFLGYQKVPKIRSTLKTPLFDNNDMISGVVAKVGKRYVNSEPYLQ